MDQVVLFRLIRNDFVQRSILVEEKIGVSISKNASALRGEHKELLASVRNLKRSTPVLAAIQGVAVERDFCLSIDVDFSSQVFIAFRTQLICRVIADCGQRFYGGAFGARSRSRSGGRDLTRGCLRERLGFDLRCLHRLLDRCVRHLLCRAVDLLQRLAALGRLRVT